MAFYHALISTLITAIWCHDLLFFDEFQFQFNLNNEDNWDYYHINNNHNSLPSLLNNKYLNKLHPNGQSAYHHRHLLSLSAPNYARTCTNTIPLIMKQLCVHWKHDQGFKYHFQTPSHAHKQDTNWYYIHNNDHDIISDAATADEYYSTLDHDMRYIGDDSDWNEINYANDLSSFTLNNEDNNNEDYFHNFGKGSFKQCRHSLRMRECAMYHIPSKTLSINVKVGRARKYTEDVSFAKDVMPFNMYQLQGEAQRVNEYINAGKEDNKQKSAYDFHAEFEYGDSMGYDNWANDVMHWRSFECMNCNQRRLYQDIESDYATYGDYTYMFNEYGLDFDNDDDWFDITDDKKMKCTIAIPGFEHKVCVDMHNALPNKGAEITFAAADDLDIDYGYYDIYGYDAYYYNIDHLYKHKDKRRVLIEDEYHMFGGEDYEIGYNAMERFYDALNEELIDSIRNELSDIKLHFLDDNSWNDITTIYDDENNKYIRKCASFQTSSLCATHSLSHPHKALTFDLRIGKHKYHRSLTHPFAATMNYMNVYDDQQQQQHWIISDDTLDIDDDEWNDANLWHPTIEQITSQLQKMVRQRCRYHTFCLCQYMDAALDNARKHPCARGNPHHPQKVVHVMDDFIKNPQAEFIPLHHQSSPLKIEFHYKPHIQHLHVVGGFPYFHRRHHVKRYRIPWYQYARYEDLRPKVKPDWLPHWMWNEIGAHTRENPMTVQEIMRDLKGEKLGGKKVTGNPLIPLKNEIQKGKNGEIKRYAQNLLSRMSQGYSAHDIENDNEFEYYDYDDEFADQLDAQENDDTADMVRYVFPLMQNAVQSIMPVFEAINGMMGTAWDTIADKVGIRRRMEVNHDIADQKAWIMSESNTIHDMVKNGLPNERPLWFPHYFWHWLHHAPHFHILLHRKRVPWIASSARYYDGDNKVYKAAQDTGYNYYQFGDENEVDYAAFEDEMYEYEYSMDNDNDMTLNALGNGDDFMGNTDGLNDSMWRFERILFMLFIGGIFCLMASCFVWRSKWGELIRKLNERRLERKQMKDLMSEDEESSSLNISDVAPLHY